MTKNLYWIAGLILGVLYFVIGEVRAFYRPDKINTLSRFMADLGSRFPLTLVIVGMLIGSLCTHFWWH